MLSPSTAPRWKRQTKMRRSGGPAVGGTARAALARKRGSKPKLNNARPPDFTKTRLEIDRKSTRLNSSHSQISYAVFCLKKKKKKKKKHRRKTTKKKHSSAE